MLIYTAELKMPQEHSYAFKLERVEELLELLALNSCRDVKIGSNMAKGISGIPGKVGGYSAELVWAQLACLVFQGMW